MLNLAPLLQKAESQPTLPPPSDRRRIRECAGVSQHDIAVTVGVDRATVSRWEAGLLTPQGGHLSNYSLVLGELERIVARRASA
jgi:DNA-binding transcriptional regulator YiaG